MSVCVLIKTNGLCGTLITMPITGRVRILPGWGVGQRSMSLQAVGKSNIEQSAVTVYKWSSAGPFRPVWPSVERPYFQLYSGSNLRVCGSICVSKSGDTSEFWSNDLFGWTKIQSSSCGCEVRTSACEAVACARLKTWHPIASSKKSQVRSFC